jgi:hypothetical protein
MDDDLLRIYEYLQSLFTYWKEKFLVEVIEWKRNITNSLHFYIRPSVSEMVEQMRRYGNISEFPYQVIIVVS